MCLFIFTSFTLCFHTRKTKNLLVEKQVRISIRKCMPFNASITYLSPPYIPGKTSAKANEYIFRSNAYHPLNIAVP